MEGPHREPDAHRVQLRVQQQGLRDQARHGERLRRQRLQDEHKWVGDQETWGESELKSRQSMLEDRFVELWPSISTSYQPTREVPDEDSWGMTRSLPAEA